MNQSVPPKAKKIPHETTMHGITWDDPYAWLRDDNWQQVMQEPEKLAPDIRDYLTAENAHSENIMAPVADEQKQLFNEMKGRIKQDDSSVPSPDGAYAYGVKFISGGQQPVYIRTNRIGGDEVILIDGNALAEGKPFFRLGGTGHAPDHRHLAWSYDDKGSEYYKLLIRDMTSGQDLPDEISHTSGGAVWSAAGDSLFYVRLDDNHRPSKLYCHHLGSKVGDDKLVFEEHDAGFFLGCGKTHSGRYIVVHSHDHQTSEISLIPADKPNSPPILVAEREPGHEYEIEEAHGQLYILTNADGAEDFKIVTAPADNPGRENWQDLIAHKPGTLILALTVYSDFLIRLERSNGLPRLVIRMHDSGEEHAIAFAEEAYSLGMSSGYEFTTDIIRFSYSSMTTPSQLFDYNVRDHSRNLLKSQEVPSGHEASDYITRRIMAPASDGVLVPVSLLYHKDTALDGSAPGWLYGYGSYGISMPASFNTNILSLVDRGFVYAIAHIRGGKELGYDWYKQGKHGNKRNTFTDFLAAANHLETAGLVAKDSIIAQGGSAGGMLMGAVANMAPALFRAIIAEVPFVDVLNTMVDDTLPLTPPEWPEWGNPIASEEDFAYIRSYSPYDNVTVQNYPHILAVAGLTDPRVTYWEPAKWVARLRDNKTDDNLLLLKTQMEAGHAGSPGRFDRLKEVAFVYAFALLVSDKAGIDSNLK